MIYRTEKERESGKEKSERAPKFAVQSKPESRILFNLTRRFAKPGFILFTFVCFFSIGDFIFLFSARIDNGADDHHDNGHLQVDAIVACRLFIWRRFHQLVNVSIY